jgi:hypothetical protein
VLQCCFSVCFCQHLQCEKAIAIVLLMRRPVMSLVAFRFRTDNQGQMCSNKEGPASRNANNNDNDNNHDNTKGSIRCAQSAVRTWKCWHVDGLCSEELSLPTLERGHKSLQPQTVRDPKQNNNNKNKNNNKKNYLYLAATRFMTSLTCHSFKEGWYIPV